MSKTLNIVYHFRVRGTGAESVHISGIATGFRKLGHHVSFVSPGNIDPTRKNVGIATSNSSRIQLLNYFADHAPQILFELGELYYNLPGSCKLKKKIQQQNIDLIFERYAFFNLVGTWISQRRHIPLILEVNELSGYDRVRSQKMINLAKKIERIIFRQASLIVVVSNFLREKIAEIINNDSKIIVVPNGVTQNWLDNSFPEQYLIRLKYEHNLVEKKIIGFVGELDHWHNFDFVLELIADLKHFMPDIVLLIVGDGPLRKDIQAKAQKLNIMDAIRITGRVPHSDVKKYIKLFDIALIPHSNQYRSPIKLFEYMATGKAVVAPITEPIKSVITDNVDGLLFKSADKIDAFHKISGLLSDTDFKEKIAHNSLKKIKSQYLYDIHSKNILNAFINLRGNYSVKINS